MARKGRVGAHVDLPWVGRRGTLPTACGEPCLRQGSSVLEPTLNVLKFGVRTRPKCQSDEMAPAVASLVSGLALLTATTRLGSTRRTGRQGLAVAFHHGVYSSRVPCARSPAACLNLLSALAYRGRNPPSCYPSATPANTKMACSFCKPLIIWRARQDLNPRPPGS